MNSVQYYVQKPQAIWNFIKGAFSIFNLIYQLVHTIFVLYDLLLQLDKNVESSEREQQLFYFIISPFFFRTDMHTLLCLDCVQLHHYQFEHQYEIRLFIDVNVFIVGKIPSWLSGCLIRNGPGGVDVYGKGTCRHLFDGPGLLHKYHIENGKVTYSSRFVKGKSFKRNMAARRLVLSEFGTFATPDPCQTIFSR